MAFSFEFDLDLGVVRVVARGNADFADNHQAIIDLMRRPEFEAVSSVLCDFREFDYVPSANDCLSFGRMLASTRPFRSRRLVYVVSPAHLNAARTVAIVARVWGMEIEVFESPEAARGWLLAARTP